MMDQKGAPLMDRLLARVHPEPNSGCWLWLGAVNNKGYGQIRINRKTYLAHREMLSAVAPADANLLACHRCDVPCCINPDHLFWGTQSDNLQDAIRKGRMRPHNSFWIACSHGHAFTEKNTRISKEGKRRCRQCERERMRVFYWNKRKSS